MKSGPESPLNFSSAQKVPTEITGEKALEEALRDVLKAQEAPGGFADRVVARALGGQRPTPLHTTASRPAQVNGLRPRWLSSLLAGSPGQASRPWILGGALAAALVAGVLEGGLTLRRVHQQQQRVAAATLQWQTSEQVTFRALAQAREQMQRAGVPLDVD